MRKFLYPYHAASESARVIAQRAGLVRIKRERSRYRPRSDDLVINWGCGRLPDWEPMPRILNKPDKVYTAGDKLRAFSAMPNAVLVEWTTSKTVALDWINTMGCIVYARTQLRGHSGAGIVVCRNSNELVDAPLYTKGITGRRREYRVHVGGGNILLVQQKRKRRETECSADIRNQSSGWVYVVHDIQEFPAYMIEVATLVVSELELDFGAVDIIVDRRDTPWVLEVNTAPGLTGESSTNAYVNFFSNL